MTDSIAPAAARLPIATDPAPTKVEDAAKQFEGLMIGQMLRSARELDNSDGDSESATLFDIADQQFAKVLANNGGMGLARMVVGGLKQAEQKAHGKVR